MSIAELNDPYPLSEVAIEQFRADGFIRLPNVLSGETLAAYAPEIDRIVGVRNKLAEIPLAQRTLYQQSFIQVCNVWRDSKLVRELAFSARLARIATGLLGTRGVRMWHDQALYKEPSGGVTPWHVDQQYWPMANSLSVTAWIPLQAVPLDMGPLQFGRGSHQKRIGRDLEISAESERHIGEEVTKQGIIEVQEPFALGDVSFHYGWTLHRAGPNTTKDCRRVFTIIYMDRDMRLAEPQNRNQQVDWEVWTPSTKIGEVMDDELNPILWCAE